MISPKPHERQALAIAAGLVFLAGFVLLILRARGELTW